MREAGTSSAARQKATSWIAVALVELRLSDTHGIALVRALCVAVPTCHIIAMTADDTARLHTDALSAGAPQVLVKSLDLHVVVTHVRRAAGIEWP